MPVKVTSHAAEVLEALRQRKLVALEACGLAGETFAKQKVPVDTGNLKNSITHTVDGDTAYIGTNVEYAVYVEMGTGRQAMYGGNQTLSGMRARPYLKPALTDNIEIYGKIIEKYLKN